VLAALLFFMRTEENGSMTFAVISLAIGAVFSSVSAAITLKNKDKNDADDNTDEQTNDNPEKK
jgi:mannitol-specific phosphotransferase system IIBC component